MRKLHVIVTTKNDIFYNEIMKQLIDGDTVNFVDLDILPSRHLDDLIVRGKGETIVIINKEGPVPVPGFLNDFREAFVPSRTFVRKGNELLKGGFLASGMEHIHGDDCICFDRNQYRTQLRNINPFSDYKRCLVELALITNDLMVPTIRKFPDLTLLQEIVDSGGIIPEAGVAVPPPAGPPKSEIITEYERIKADAAESEKLTYLNSVTMKENPEDREKWMSWMEEK
jgi:hypothetical protein